MKQVVSIILIALLFTIVACSKEVQEEADAAVVSEQSIDTELDISGRWSTSTGGWFEFGEDNDFTTDAGETGVYTLVGSDPMKIQLESDTRDVEYPIDLLSPTEMHWMRNGIIILTLTRDAKPKL